MKLYLFFALAICLLLAAKPSQAQLPCPTSITAIPNGDSVIVVLTPPSFDPTLFIVWDFGDGASATGGTTQTHVYTASGVYNVCATFSTLSCPITLSCTSITISAAAACPDSILTLVNADSVTCILMPPSFDPTLTATWTFGDGTTASGTNATHSYEASGTYVVCCEYSSATCPISSDCSMITVLVPVPILCDYSFNYDVAGNSVLFNNTPDVAATATVLWTFGDSTATSTINDPTYVYSAPGQYVVCFNVIDLANCGASPFISCDTVTIIGVSIADYNTSGVEVYPNPSSGSIAIDVRRNDIQTLDLLDEHGRVLYSSKQADLNERIAIQSLPKGVYLLHVTTASTVFSTKIIVL